MSKARQWLGYGLLLACIGLLLFVSVEQSMRQKKAPPRGVALLPALQEDVAVMVPWQVAETGLDLNQASLEELQTLPGIGPKIAALIVATREQQPFFFIEDLRLVPGIGEKRIEALRGLVYVKPIEAPMHGWESEDLP